MQTLGYSTAITKIIQSYLENRRYRVKLNTTFSTWRPITAGVPQGSLLSPLLFNIYIADIPKTQGATISLYADDLLITASDRNINFSKQLTQEATNKICTFYNKWKIKVNPSKTKAITFTKRRTNPNQQILINDQPLPWVNEINYLGVTMDKKLIWKKHIEKIKSKALQQNAILYPLINRNSKLSIKTKLNLYNSYIKPILTYGSPAWCFASKTVRAPLQTLQNKILRQAINAPWFIRNADIHKDLKQPTIIENIRSLIIKSYTHAQQHQNPLLRNAVNYSTDDILKHKRPKSFLLQ